jgi:hypothetical protein
METLNLTPQPFGISFHWQDKYVKITLKDGEDILKIAREFANFLDNSKIEYEIKMENIESI